MDANHQPDTEDQEKCCVLFGDILDFGTASLSRKCYSQNMLNKNHYITRHRNSTVTRTVNAWP